MTDLFDAFKHLKVTPKKHFVTISGENVEVALDQKVEIIRVGADNYELRDGKPVRKVTRIDRNRFPEIDNFHMDPYWPDKECEWKR